jgi:hypothetical protein
VEPLTTKKNQTATFSQGEQNVKGPNRLFAVFSLMLMLLTASLCQAETIQSYKAGGTITAALRLKVTAASTVNTAGIADEDIGVALAGAATNTQVPVVMNSDGEIGTYVADGVITAGDHVYPAASGKVSATVAGKRIGIAVTTTAADGDSIKVLKLAPGVDRVVVRHVIAAASVDDWLFVADRAYTVVSIKEVHSVAGNDGGAVTLDLRKVTAVAAPGAAAGATVKELLATALDLKSTANTTVTGTLSATAADLSLAAGDKIGANFVGTLTTLAGGVVVIELKPK